MKLVWNKQVLYIDTNKNKSVSHTTHDFDDNVSFGIMYDNHFCGGKYVLFMTISFGDYHITDNSAYTRLDNAKRAANKLYKAFYNKFKITGSHGK